MKISEKQKKFSDEYIKNGGNATRAAKAAGYSDRSARQIGAKLLTKHDIKSYIADRMEEIRELEERDIMSLAEIQKRRSAIAKGEVTDSFGFAPDFSDQLKAMDCLEKTLVIKQEKKEKEEAARRALEAKEYHLDLYNIPDSFHAAIRSIRDHTHTEFVFEGGRGSTKSSSIAMIIPEIMKNHHDVHAVAIRKVGNTIKDSVYSKIQWAMDKQDIEEQFDEKKSPLEMTIKATEQKIYFRGADDPKKIKSISPKKGYIGILWFEEADQFEGEAEIRNIIQSVCRGGDKVWIFFSYNPPKSKSHWIHKFVAQYKPERLVHHSTYHDVPKEWLGKAFIDEAEWLKESNPEAYDNEYEGVANGNGGNVFENITFREIKDKEIEGWANIYQGVDWGWYPDIYAFVRLYYDRARDTIYFIDEFTGNKMTNVITGNEIKKRGYDDYKITCDSAENKSIKDYRDLGLQARAAVKGPGSVEYGMKWLASRKFVIDRKRTPKIADEFENYEYERDKEGNVISGYPDANNHTIDATRYALESFYSKRGNNA